MDQLYDSIGKEYSNGRTTDPTIAFQFHRYLIDVKTILNVGAGSGSYEPINTNLYAIEPSKVMIKQRPLLAHPVCQAIAESLPFKDAAFSHVRHFGISLLLQMEKIMKSEITEIGQLAITVDNVKEALNFYHNILGLEFLFSPSENLAFVKCGSTRIMLTTPQGAGEIGKNSIPYFKTSNLESFYSKIIELGATAERSPQLAAKMPDHDLWIGFVKDPDGNLIGLMEEKYPI